MSAPYEIVAAPLRLYLAPVGTPFPEIHEGEEQFSPLWFLVGSSGERNYSDDGVMVNADQTITYFRPAGGTLARKAFRTDEDFYIGVGLADLSPDQYAKILNDVAVTTIEPAGGQPGEKRFSLHRGSHVATYSLLARGVSTDDDLLNAQYEVDSVIEASNKQIPYRKGDPSLLTAEFRTIDAEGAGDGIEHRVQTSHFIEAPADLLIV